MKKLPNRLTPQDIKQALWDERFRELFPEFKEQILTYMKDPGCGTCRHGLINTLMGFKDRLRKYFPTKEVITPQEEKEQIKHIKNSWKVINCNVHNLAEKLKEIPRGKRLIAASRFRDKMTLVLNDVDALMTFPTQNIEEALEENRKMDLNWKVINTTIHDLENELAGVEGGRKILQITRYKEQVTAIINDLTSLF